MREQAVLFALLLLLAACHERAAPSQSSDLTHSPLAQCAKDTDCKGERICESGKCAYPQKQVLEKESATAPSAQTSSQTNLPPAREPTLNKIFLAKNLQSNIEFFEKITGPARETYGQERIYEVDGCEVIGITSGKLITAIGINVKKGCSFDLNRFLPNYDGKFPPIDKLTMQKFQSIVGGGVEYYVPCFDCGSSMDPISYSYWIGPHSDGVLEVRLETEGLPSSVWEAVRKESYDFNFNCKPNKLESLARNDPPQGAIQSIVVGYSIPTEKCD